MKEWNVARGFPTCRGIDSIVRWRRDRVWCVLWKRQRGSNEGLSLSGSLRHTTTNYTKRIRVVINNYCRLLTKSELSLIYVLVAYLIESSREIVFDF